jgi:hypothetical protein
MTKLCYHTFELVNAKSRFALEILKEMSTNRTLPMLALLAMISLSLAGCGGGGMASSSTSGQPGHTATGHPTGMWRTLPVSMPINPIHAALLHTGKILIVSGSGNCPPTQAGCPLGPQYSQGAALLDLSSGKITTMPTGWDMFCNGMSIMQDGRVLINGGTKGYGSLAVVGVNGEIPFTGLPNTSIFDPGTETFLDVAPKAQWRR